VGARSGSGGGAGERRPALEKRSAPWPVDDGPPLGRSGWLLSARLAGFRSWAIAAAKRAHINIGIIINARAGTRSRKA